MLHAAFLLAFFPQSDASARLHTAPPLLDEAVVYDVTTGLLSADTRFLELPCFRRDNQQRIYHNSCAADQFMALLPGERVFDSGQVPGTDDPNGVPCGSTYGVRHIEIEYCADQPSLDVAVAVYEPSAPCLPVMSAPLASFTIAGLPGGTAGSPVRRRLVIKNADFTLTGSGNGSWDDDPALDSFVWTFEVTNLTGALVGPVVAGDPPQESSGCGFGWGTGLVFDDPFEPDIDGTGYGSLDQFGVDTGGPSPACFDFGGWPSGPWASFRLTLRGVGDSCLTSFLVNSICDADGFYPSTSPTTCPCGNVTPPGEGGGCVNSSGISGGLCYGGGGASLAQDDFQLQARHPAGNSGLMLFNTSIFPTGVAVFDGLACVGGGPRALPGGDYGLGDDLVAFDGIRNFGSDGAGILGQVNAVFPGFFVPGASYYAQYWYRDVLCGPPPSPCSTPCTTPPPAAANFTNAVVFQTAP